MMPTTRKMLLTVHIACAVGWIGAVAAFLIVSIAALQSSSESFVAGAYLSLDLISRTLAIPLSLATLATGFVQAYFGAWGVRRYYWVLAKLSLAVVATSALMVHQWVAVGAAAQRFRTDTAVASADAAMWHALQVELVRAPSIALVLLLATLTLAVFKPWGLTAFGYRQQAARNRPEDSLAKGAPLGVRVSLAVALLLALVFILIHVLGGGFHHHGA